MSSITKTPPASRLMREAAKLNIPRKTRYVKVSKLDKWSVGDLVDALVQSSLPEDQQIATKEQIRVRLGYSTKTAWGVVQAMILSNLYRRKAFTIPIPKK